MIVQVVLMVILAVSADPNAVASDPNAIASDPNVGDSGLNWLPAPIARWTRRDAWSRLRPGMNPQAVKALLGEPLYQDIASSSMIWHYQVTPSKPAALDGYDHLVFSGPGTVVFTASQAPTSGRAVDSASAARSGREASDRRDAADEAAARRAADQVDVARRRAAAAANDSGVVNRPVTRDIKGPALAEAARPVYSVSSWLTPSWSVFHRHHLLRRNLVFSRQTRYRVVSLQNGILSASGTVSRGI